MAFVVNDRVKETTTSTGTGTINLAGAETGFESFVTGIGNSNTTYYCIQAQGGSAFEIGVGTVTDASPDTLSRTAIISSSNGDAAVDFGAGTKDVFCTLPASKAVIEDNSTNADIAGNLTIGGTVDGVDIAARDAVLTSTTTTATNANTTANAALPKAGGTMTGNLVLSSANITMSGSETVDGVDISARDAVLTSTTTTATNAETTANAALPKAGGTMTGNISHASDFTLDVGGDLILDADGGDIKLRDDGSGFGQLQNSSSDFIIQVDTQDKDILFKGDDGGSIITALTLDMSEGGVLVCNSDIAVPDNGKIELGAGDDLQLFHDTNNSQIINNTGALKFRSGSYTFRSVDDATNSMIATPAGAVELYHNGTKIVETSANGLEIPTDNLELRIGAGADLKLFHDGNHSVVQDAGTGHLQLSGSTVTITKADRSGTLASFVDGGANFFYHNTVQMAETTANGFKVSDDRRFEIGNGSNWSGEQAGKIEHHSNNMYHQFTTNWIARNASGTDVFNVDSSGNGTFNANCTAYSDYRIKENINTIDNALDKVCKLRGVEYTRKETKAREIGVIAQEVKEIVPELVAIQNLKTDMNPDALEDMHTMKYQNTVGLLIEAIKDLKAEVEELKKAK